MARLCQTCVAADQLADYRAISSYEICRAVLALALGRYVEAQLYGVPSRDVASLVGAAGVLMAVALASGWLPARQASRIDPMRALAQ